MDSLLLLKIMQREADALERIATAFEKLLDNGLQIETTMTTGDN